MNRQIILDTETTGLEPREGHRIIEIGCVEMINRRITDKYWHHYLQPDREIDAGAFEVHGISNDFLADKPRFAELAQEFLDYIRGAELVIHNAAFDIGFLDHELSMLEGEWPKTADLCRVTDSLLMARQKHPGQKNNLDALCKRYDIDNSNRTLHGALLDSEILAEVYLAMTGGQTMLTLDEESHEDGEEIVVKKLEVRDDLPLWQVPEQDLEAHRDYLEFLAEKADSAAW